MSPMKALQIMIGLYGQSGLARELSSRSGERVTQGNIWSWLHRSKKIPPQFAPHLEALALEKGRRIGRAVFCPKFPWEPLVPASTASSVAGTGP